jgi:hypothetical protein
VTLVVKFWKSPQFEVLEEEWDQKLEDSGFEDQEKKVNGERALKIPTSCLGRTGGVFRHNRSEVKRNSKIEYFALISEWVQRETDYEDESDRLIMERTAEGKRIREISEELQKLGMRKHNRITIRFIRRRYEDRWGIKKWRPVDMVSRKVLVR